MLLSKKLKIKKIERNKKIRQNFVNILNNKYNLVKKLIPNQNTILIKEIIYNKIDDSNLNNFYDLIFNFDLNEITYDLDESDIIFKWTEYFLETSLKNQNLILKILLKFSSYKIYKFKYIKNDFYYKLENLISNKIFLNKICDFLIRMILINKDDEFNFFLYNLNFYDRIKNLIFNWEGLSSKNIECVLLLFFRLIDNLDSRLNLINIEIITNILQIFSYFDINIKKYILFYLKNFIIKLNFNENNLNLWFEFLKISITDIEYYSNDSNVEYFFRIYLNFIDNLTRENYFENIIENLILIFDKEINLKSKNTLYKYYIKFLNKFCENPYYEVKLETLINIINLNELKEKFFNEKEYFEFLIFINNNFDEIEFYKEFDFDFIKSIGIFCEDLAIFEKKIEFIENVY